MRVSRLVTFCPSPRFLCRTLVIICQSLFNPIQMYWFLFWIPHLDTGPWAPFRPAVVGLWCTHKARCTKLVGGVDSIGWGCAGALKTILAREIYCFKSNSKPDSQSGSQICKLPGSWAPRSTHHAITIVIRLLTQSLTCEMGSPIFVAMNQLKVESMTWCSFPITPSTEKTTREKCFHRS